MSGTPPGSRAAGRRSLWLLALLVLLPQPARAQAEAEARVGRAVEIYARALDTRAQAEARARVERAVEIYARALDTKPRDLRVERFRQAERLFGSAVAQGVENADLYTNQGNASLQAGNLGGAVLAYRRALRLDPDHERARQNLAHARTLLPEWVPRPERAAFFDTFFFWHRTLSRAERSLGAAGLFAVACALAAVAIRWRSALARGVAVVLALGWLGLLISLLVDVRTSELEDVVLTAPETVARAADSINAPARLAQPLPGGTEGRILERRQGWLRVGLSNGRDGWVPESSVTVVSR